MSQIQVPMKNDPDPISPIPAPAETVTEQPVEMAPAVESALERSTIAPETSGIVPASVIPEPRAEHPEQPEQPAPHTPARQAAHGAIVTPREVAPRRTISTWWHNIPSGGRRALTQTVFTIVIVLLLLPLASITGLLSFGPARSTGGGVVTSTATTQPIQPKHMPAHAVFDAQPPAPPSGATVELNLVTKEALVAIAPGVAYQAWTFNGTVPGPILRVRQGQTVHFTLTNASGMPHSIDFHAAQTPWSVNYQPVAPGKSFSFTWKANYPGIFMYHCGTPPAMVHMANGMYGAIIVDPANGWDSAQEYVLVQSEFYARQTTDGTYILDGTSMMNAMPNYVVFNGYANQYKDAPLTAKAGQKVRLFVVNAGPSLFSAFHVIGGIFSDVYIDGNPANHLVGDQTVTIPPGGGAVMELTTPDAGLYPFLTHSFSGADMGAIGVLKVTQ